MVVGSLPYLVRRKQEADLLLLLRVRNCANEEEYRMLRDQWDCINRPEYARRTWSVRQEVSQDAASALEHRGRLQRVGPPTLQAHCAIDRTLAKTSP